MTHEMKNMMELNSFKDKLSQKKDFGRDGVIFKGLITYSSMNTTVTEILDVYLIIGGYTPMIKLDIYAKARIITSETYHLDLNPMYDNITFKFDSGKMIIIGD